MRPLLILTVFLCGCANQTFYRTGKDEKGKTIAVKAFHNSGDLVGEVEMGPDYLRVTLPQGPIPVERFVSTNSKGETIIHEIPIMPGIYNSRVNNGNWAGASKLVDSVGNAVGKGVAAGALPGIIP